MRTRLESHRRRLDGELVPAGQAGPSTSAASMLRLQQQAGNAAITAMIQRVANQAPKQPRQEVAWHPNLRIAVAEMAFTKIKRGGPVFVNWTIVNEGTGRTRPGDMLWITPSVFGSAHSRWDRKIDLGKPAIPASGGISKGSARLSGSHFKIVSNDWKLHLGVTYANELGREGLADTKVLPFEVTSGNSYGP